MISNVLEFALSGLICYVYLIFRQNVNSATKNDGLLWINNISTSKSYLLPNSELFTKTMLIDSFGYPSQKKSLTPG